jgi:hypothetical protein
MSNWTITITQGDAATGNLTLSPSGTLVVQPGDIVSWVIGTNSGVAAISAIIEKPGPNHDVFSPDPAPVSGTTSWQGTINPNFTSETEEAYSIQWTTAGSGWLNQGGGQTKTYDPIIKVNPK